MDLSFCCGFLSWLGLQVVFEVFEPFFLDGQELDPPALVIRPTYLDESHQGGIRFWHLHLKVIKLTGFQRPRKLQECAPQTEIRDERLKCLRPEGFGLFGKIVRIHIAEFDGDVAISSRMISFILGGDQRLGRVHWFFFQIKLANNSHHSKGRQKEGKTKEGYYWDNVTLIPLKKEAFSIRTLKMISCL